MSSLSYHDIIEQIEQLAFDEQRAIWEHLQEKFHFAPPMPGLLGLYPRPDLDLSFEEIEQTIHENPWESEIDEFFGN